MIVQLRRKIKAQSTAEYAIFFGIIIAAAIGMQRYVQRGMQGRLKSATDMVGAASSDAVIDGTGVSLGVSGQYVPYYVERDTSIQRSHQSASQTVTWRDDEGFGRAGNQERTVESGAQQRDLLWTGEEE